MPDEPDREVLSSLPRTRPTRRSPRRAGGQATSADAAPAPRRPPPPNGWATAEEARAGARGDGMVADGVRAVGELAGIGAAIAGQGVRSLLSRLPLR